MNDSSKTNVLELITERLNAPSGKKLAASYPSQEAKKPSQEAKKKPAPKNSGEIDVDELMANRNSAAAARQADPRKQRRRRRHLREQQPDRKPAAQMRRVHTLPAPTAGSNPTAPKSDEEIKRLARATTASGPVPKNSVEIEMGDGSQIDMLQLVAYRASQHDDQSESDSSSDSSDPSSSSEGDQRESVPSRASIHAVAYTMSDMSGTTRGNGDLKTSSVTVPTTVAGAYQAAPGQGYVRTEQFAGVLGGTPMSDPSEVSLQYSSGGAPLEQARHRRRSMQDASVNKILEDASARTQQHPVISAVRVDEDDLELQLREQITNSAAQAHVVDLEKETNDLMKTELYKVQKKYFGVALICLLVVIGVVVAVVAVTATGGNESGGQQNGGGSLSQAAIVHPTLHTVAKKGHLNCGLSKRDEDANFHPEYEQMWEGFNGDFCKAVGAAALGGDVNVTIHRVTESERWEALQNGTLDVLVVGTPGSTESLHFDLDREIPATFSTPFLFDGVGVGGQPEYIETCATTKGFENFLDCRNVRVCAVQGSTALEAFERILHPSQIVEVASFEDLYNRFANGCCNMIATDWSNERAEVTVRKESGYEGPYQLGEALYSKQPYALGTLKVQNDHPIDATDDAVRQDDPQVWSEFVDWVLQSLIAAEQNNITQDTAHLITQTEVFGDKYRDAFKQAVAAVGNYGEIYERNMGHVVPRDGMNLIADGSTGLHYHRSIGDVTDYGTLLEDGTLAAIKERGKLVCGVPIIQNQNFTLEAGEVATQPPSRFLEDLDAEDDLGGAGIDMEFCRALASSIFQGLSITHADSDSCLVSPDGNETEATSDARIEFVLLTDPADGYTKLNDGDLDVIAGYRMTLEGDVKEPTTGKGYAFSQPYLYGPVLDTQHVTANNRCLVTRQHDQQWSDFVQIVAMSIFYAEEHHIDQPHANAMPYVNLFGPTYKRMMKDSVFAVGNYGEVYERLVEPYLHRAGGPNTLNAEADPQLCSFPGPII